MDEGTNGMAAAMELHGLTGAGAKQGAGNDAIELLAGAIDIGGAGEHHRKSIGMMEAVQVQITGCPADGIGSAGGEVVVLFDPATIGAAVHLWGSDMHVFLQKGFLAQGIVQGHLGHHIGAIPLGGIEPAFGHHALGGEVHHKLGLHPIDQSPTAL